MYAAANMGHPSREEGFVLCSNRSAADEVILGHRISSIAKSVLLAAQSARWINRRSLVSGHKRCQQSDSGENHDRKTQRPKIHASTTVKKLACEIAGTERER